MTEVEEAQVSPRVKQEAKLEEEADIESQIRRTMRSHVPYFKEQADSLTLENIRRLLEKDLGLEMYALDVHKRFIRNYLEECLDHWGDDNGSKSSIETVDKNDSTSKGEMDNSAEKEQTKKDAKEASSKDGVNMDDSPVMGLLMGHDKAKSQEKDNQGTGKKGIPTESIIKDAIKKRASYLKANSDKITMAGVRKLLEEDLKLDKNTLHPFKKFISVQVDAVLTSPKVYKPTSNVKKKDFKKSSRGKASEKESIDEGADSLDSESKGIEENAKSRKQGVPKRKIQKSVEPKKRKGPATGTKASNKKQRVVAENSDAEADGALEDDQSLSADEKPVKRKEAAASSNGKRVEYLKTVIKSCGMSVPPAVYKRAKQVFDEKREAFLIKELEEILSREGLSADPSEKEIKDVKKRKERAKELEGIDMSNIVSSTRRRSTTGFVPPPKPKITVESEEDDSEESSDNESDSEDDNDEGDDANKDNDGQSEEVNEDDDGGNSD